MHAKISLELNLLIVTIAQEGNFVRASKRLGITPPSLTRRVSLLEKSIGVKLFERSTRRHPDGRRTDFCSGIVSLRSSCQARLGSRPVSGTTRQWPLPHRLFSIHAQLLFAATERIQSRSASGRE